MKVNMQSIIWLSMWNFVNQVASANSQIL